MTDPIPCIEPDVPGRDGRGGLLLRAPYREDFVFALKAALPGPHRYWDIGIGAWWVDRSDAALLAEIVLDFFPTLVILGGIGEENEVLHRSGRSPHNKYLQSFIREVL